ncbi:sequestosome-1 isoform X2 [Pogonomyrmex barbatus]|uniref:Sequestosome-1 isoform X2 n=1 Tax=Pogonomyrmex barbatus TaxID=144034 RepID=A0A6I9WE00_9HYME|nr:sequestosome-1 isoform X2 [Pogonomyrmex barbatus]
MAQYSFKVYLVREDPWTTCTEVRRFGIDADVATNFVYLYEKLQTIFPNLRGKSFTVTWKDSENETITISTNEELELALSEMSKNDIYKLHVWLQSERDMDDVPKMEKILHPGVVCDVCDKDIRGFRFKCIQCPDYDLCTNCMILGNHAEHYMVRMTQPIEYQNHRFAHHMQKFMKKVHHCMEDKHKCPKRDGNRERKRPKEQHNNREPSAEAATEATEDPQQKATRHTFSQLLKIVEDNISNISQFLDPLGINVTVMTDNDSNKKKPADNAQAKSDTQKPGARTSTSEDTAKKFPGEGKKLRDEQPVNAAAGPSADNASVTSQKDLAGTSTEQAAEAEEWTMIQRDNSSRNSSASSIILNETISPQAMSSPPSAPMAEPEKAAPSSQGIYPSLPEEVRNQSYHPNPKIQRAVEAMMAMGFTNEGSWLTHLLVAQNGDIDKALDVIHPVRRH